jgi:hypothetical protein
MRRSSILIFRFESMHSFCPTCYPGKSSHDVIENIGDEVSQKSRITFSRYGNIQLDCFQSEIGLSVFDFGLIQLITNKVE